MKWDAKDFEATIFSPSLDFELAASSLWQYQLRQNPVISEFCQLLHQEESIHLPIDLFKYREMKSGADWKAEAIFESSGTTGQVPSKHFVRDLEIYKQSILKGFHSFFPEQSYRIMALLPSYLERGNSSLVQMAKIWMDHFGLPGSGFYLNNFKALEQAILEGKDAGEPIILLGVSFALLDFAASYPLSVPSDSIIIETGGMKGRRKEITRKELHEALGAAFQQEQIYSEYGMTELLSQAYSVKSGRFKCPPWMKVEIGDIHLPTHKLPFGQSGRILITDLANIHSCAFIATEDLGIAYEDGSFEVLGRIDQSELRGCSLMYR